MTSVVLVRKAAIDAMTSTISGESCGRTLERCAARWYGLRNKELRLVAEELASIVRRSCTTSIRVC